MNASPRSTPTRTIRRPHTRSVRRRRLAAGLAALGLALSLNTTTAAPAEAVTRLVRPIALSCPPGSNNFANPIWNCEAVYKNKGNQGNIVIFRTGSLRDNFGATKMLWKHGVTTTTAAAVIVNNRHPRIERGYDIYELYFTAAGAKTVTLRVVVNPNGASRADYPDRSQEHGLITAYCVGVPVCPSWVNPSILASF